MNFENINSFKRELNQIQIEKSNSNGYYLLETANSSPVKAYFELLLRNAISDLYQLNEQQKLDVLKDFWHEEGIMFNKLEVAKKCVIKKPELTSESWTSIIHFFNSMFSPEIEINAKDFDKSFLSDLKEVILNRLGYIRGFIKEIKTRFFEDRFIDFIAVPKKLKPANHFIEEIRNKKTVPNQFHVKQNLYQYLKNISEPKNRIEYFKSTIEPIILKDSQFDTSNSREEAILNAKRNAAILFNVPVEQIEDTGYGLMPNNVFKELFKPYNIEYNSLLAERQADLLWRKIKSDIDKEIAKCRRADIPINDTVEILLKEFKNSYGSYKYTAEKPSFERLCFDKYIEPYLNSLRKNKKIEDEKTEMEEITFQDFFDIDKISEPQILKLQNTFSSYIGKNLAALIHLLKNKHKMAEIIPHSNEKGLNRFCKLLTHKERKESGASKFLNADYEWTPDETDETLASVTEKLNKILENKVV